MNLKNAIILTLVIISLMGLYAPILGAMPYQNNLMPYYGQKGKIGNQFSEHKAKTILKKIERKNPNSHLYSRHSASTTLNQQRIRAKNGITPDGQIMRPMPGARWLKHKYQLYYFNKALKIHQKTGQSIIDISAPHHIGEGYLNRGKKYVKTKRARFVFNRGKIITAFPLLK